MPSRGAFLKQNSMLAGGWPTHALSQPVQPPPGRPHACGVFCRMRGKPQRPGLRPREARRMLPISSETGTGRIPFMHCKITPLRNGVGEKRAPTIPSPSAAADERPRAAQARFGKVIGTGAVNEDEECFDLLPKI